MKKLQLLLVVSLIVASVNFIRCSKDNNKITSTTKLDTLSISHSMKGWELYSWPIGNDWSYSILMGTNRAKSINEVITNRIAVVGKDSLKMILGKFPAKEEIIWIGKRSGVGWENLSLPDGNTIDEIKNYCNQKELALSVMN